MEENMDKEKLKSTPLKPPRKPIPNKTQIFTITSNLNLNNCNQKDKPPKEQKNQGNLKAQAENPGKDPPEKSLPHERKRNPNLHLEQGK
jgi:hypothetical protein